MLYLLTKRRRSRFDWKLALLSSVASTALLSFPAVAQTVPPGTTAVTFFGEDFNSKSPNALPTTPESAKAKDAFFANLKGVGTENFESFTVGTSNPIISFAGAGKATLNGTGTVDAGADGGGRYPISGKNYYNAGSDAFSITFSSAIAAFGFYGTDIGDFGGQLTLTLTKVGGGTTVLTVPNNTESTADGSALYYGFYDTKNQYKSITFGNSATGSDVFGFDDFSVGSITQVVPVSTINTTGGDISPDTFSLGSAAAKAKTLDFEGGILQMKGGAFVDNIITAPVTIGAKNGTVDTSTGNGGFSGVVSGPGSLTIAGGGTFSLTNANSYKGGTIVNASTVAVGSATSLGTGALTLDGGTLRSAVKTGSALVVGNNIVVGAQGGTIDSHGAHGLDLRGNITDGRTAGSLTFADTKSDPNHRFDIVLYGANTFSGGAVIRDGAQVVTTTMNGIGSGFLQVDRGGELGLGGVNQTITQLTGNGTVYANGYLRTAIKVSKLTVESGAFSGILSDGHSSRTVAGKEVDYQGVLTLVKTSSGMLTLNGDSTYTGGTTLRAGTLAVGNDAALGAGALTMSRNTTLAFAANDVVLANAVILSGAGDPTIDTGANDATMSGSVSGPGDLTKIGTGTLDLTGTNTYTGPTTVAQGTLLVDGSIAGSAVTVEKGAGLGGTGTIGGLTVLSGATLAPGAQTAFSTLRIGGDATFQPGSTLQIRIDAGGRTDVVAVRGTATIAGSAVAALGAPGTYSASERYTFLTAAGGRKGTFSSITASSNLAFLAPTLSYGTNDVTLGFTQTAGFGTVATTPNQAGVAGAITSLGPGNPIYDILVEQTPQGAKQALTLLSGEAHASTTTSATTSARAVTGLVFDRLWNIAGSGGGDAMSVLDQFGPTTLPTLLRCYAPTDPGSAGETPSHYSVWGQAIGDFGRSGGDGNGAAVSRTLGGFTLGADTRVDAKGFDNWRIGVAGGYTNTGFDVASGGGSGSFETVFGTLYAGARFGAVDVRLGASYGGTSTTLRRTVAFPGFNEALHSYNGGDTVQGFGEIGYRIAVLPKVVLEPVVDVAVTAVHQDSYREKGGAAALLGSAQDTMVASTVLGFRGEATPFADLPVVARLFLGWQHTYGDVNPASTVAFASGSTPFNTYGSPGDRNSVVAETGVDWRATSALTLGLAYSGQAGARDHDNSVKGRADYRF